MYFIKMKAKNLLNWYVLPTLMNILEMTNIQNSAKNFGYMKGETMSIIEAVIQGIIQGITEFLPVSSSGHLSLYQHFTGNNGEGSLLYSAVLHLGTLLAVIIAFRQTIGKMLIDFFAMIKSIFTGKFSFKNLEPSGRGVLMMIISLTMLFPFYIFKDFFENIAQDKDIIIEGICFVFTALILFLSDKCVKGKKEFGDITVKNAVTVGIFQGVALLPGVSRSGATISGGLFSGFKRETAVEYSFILGIPAIAGGVFLEAKDAFNGNIENIDYINFIIGFIAAALSGICAIKLVKLLMNSNKFRIFSIYTFIVGLTAIIVGIREKFI